MSGGNPYHDELGRFTFGPGGGGGPASIHDAGEAKRRVDEAEPVDRQGKPYAYPANLREHRLIRNPSPLALRPEPETRQEWRANLTAFEKHGKFAEVDVADLNAWQPAVEHAKTSKLVSSGEIHDGDGSVSKAIRVARVGGKLVVWDGNHRTAAARFLGQKKVKVLLLESGVLHKNGVDYRLG